MLQSSSLLPVLKYPNSCHSFCDVLDLSNIDDVHNLYSTVAWYFGAEVQYAFNGNIDKICADLEAGADAPLEAVARKIRRYYAPYCIWSRNQDNLDYYRDDVQWSDDTCKWRGG